MQSPVMLSEAESWLFDVAGMGTEESLPRPRK